MGDFGLEPLVAGDDGDAEDFGLRRLDEEKCGLEVGAGGAGGVLVDDEFALLGEGGGGEE